MVERFLGRRVKVYALGMIARAKMLRSAMSKCSGTCGRRGMGGLASESHDGCEDAAFAGELAVMQHRDVIDGRLARCISQRDQIVLKRYVTLV